MADVFKAEVKGLKEIDTVLKHLPQATARTIMRKALTQAAEPLRDEAKRLVPVRSGDLRDSIQIGTKLTRSQQSQATKADGVEIYVGAEWPKGAHAHLVEFGTRHSAPHPFLRPAFDAKNAEFQKTFGKLMWEQIAKAVKRLAKRSKR